MRKTLALFCLLLFASAALAQMDERPRAELFGGYSRMSHHIGLNGWIVGADYAPWEHFALEGQISGHYGSGNILGVVSVDNSIYDFNFGPRIFYDTSNEKVSVFGHFLLGGSHISGTTLGVKSSDSSFSWVLGGGADYSLTTAWAARGQVDFMRTSFFGNGNNDTRLSLGFVYRWAP